MSIMSARVWMAAGGSVSAALLLSKSIIGSSRDGDGSAYLILDLYLLDFYQEKCLTWWW